VVRENVGFVGRVKELESLLGAADGVGDKNKKLEIELCEVHERNIQLEEELAGISAEFDGIWQKLDLLQGENSELVQKTDQFGVLEGLYGTTKEKYENLSIELKNVLTLNSNLGERLRLESNNYKELEEDLRAAEKSKLDSESTASQELERAKKDN
jgi:flagellar biosynthesis chaperone FliJ